MLLTSRWTIEPAAHFGLPEAGKTVVPALVETPVTSGIFDTRTGKRVRYGTLSEYRNESTINPLRIVLAGLPVLLVDNILEIEADLGEAQATYEHMQAAASALCRSMTVHYAQIFSAHFQSFQDPDGNPVPVRRVSTYVLLRATIYNLDTLRTNFISAAAWVELRDSRSDKALVYFEHACTLRDFAASQEPRSLHAGMTQALAFLQLYKALTLLLGERGTDKDYQRRFRKLGLPKSFLAERVDPLYTIRCDADVAHYSENMPDGPAFESHFEAAAKTFGEVFVSYMDMRAGG